MLLISRLALHLAAAEDYNQLVLEQIQDMPVGGKYSVNHFAKIRLQSAAHFESGKFFVLPSSASPSFCSGATYLVFIRTIEDLRASGRLQLDYATLDQLMIRDQHDGEGIWGRWNANGPGTACPRSALEALCSVGKCRELSLRAFTRGLIKSYANERRRSLFMSPGAHFCPHGTH